MSRAHVRNSSKHVNLGTQQYKPNEFATQITLNMDNAWGILRCIVDICMKQEDGKYQIKKDPNKPMIRLYDIPDNTFESDNEDADDEETSEDYDEYLHDHSLLVTCDFFIGYSFPLLWQFQTDLSV